MRRGLKYNRDMYSITGVIVPQQEERTCSEYNWPDITLKEGVSLLPMERDYLFLVEGDETQPADKLAFVIPQWLSDIVRHFSKSIYIEAAFWGGTGMQASVVFAQDRILLGPEISARAINAALRQMGVDNGSSIKLFGLPFTTGADPFDMVGLGRHRAVSGWLQESYQKKH